MNNLIGYSLVLIIICLLVYMWHTDRKNWAIFCEGLWIAGDDFCSRSDLEGMMIYIGPDLGGSHKAFMIMYTDKNVVSQSLLLGISGFGCRRKIKVQPDPDSDTAETVLPEVLTARISMAAGRMVWYCDDTMYAELYKDALSSTEAVR